MSLEYFSLWEYSGERIVRTRKIEIKSGSEDNEWVELAWKIHRKWFHTIFTKPKNIFQSKIAYRILNKNIKRIKHIKTKNKITKINNREYFVIFCRWNAKLLDNTLKVIA